MKMKLRQIKLNFNVMERPLWKGILIWEGSAGMGGKGFIKIILILSFQFTLSGGSVGGVILHSL